MMGMDSRFYELMESNPVIAAVKDEEGLEACCAKEDIKVVFILYGDICNLKDIVSRLHKAGKTAIVHIDLIAGISGKEIAVQFVKETAGADGIITTKPLLIRKAKSIGMYAVLRVFMLDSLALETLQHQVATARPDVIEVLPGLMPKIIHKVVKMTRIPVIAGGLVSEKEDVVEALNAGAVSVSTTNRKVWDM